MTDKELISIVDVKAKKLWNEINTGHEYSIIDSYNQFYGICMEIAEMVQEEPSIPELVDKHWWEMLGEEPMSKELKVELEKYIKGHFTIDTEQLDRFGIEEKDYMYSMDKSDMLALVEHFINWQKTKEEPVSEDIEKVAQEYATKEGYLAGLHYNSMVRSFKAGAEWYASHNTKLSDNLLLAARKASIDMCNIDDKYLDEYPYNPIAEQKFIEGAKWQKEQDQSIIELAEDHAMLAGMEKMKEQMMAKAGNGRVDSVSNRQTRAHITVAFDSPRDIEVLDRLKVIVIKEDGTMGKAEEHIRKNTNQLSNEDGFDYVPWLTPDQARRAVEIAREEMIEKAIGWIGEINNHHHIMRYSDSCEPSLGELTEWFKNYMKEGGKDE